MINSDQSRTHTSPVKPQWSSSKEVAVAVEGVNAQFMAMYFIDGIETT